MTSRDEAAPAIRVFVEREDGREEALRFTGAFRIGRDVECEVRIDSGLVSRTHAEVTREDGRWWIRDLGSTNGIFLDGTRTIHAPLPDEARLQLGRNAPTLRLQIEPAGAPRRPASAPTQRPRADAPTVEPAPSSRPTAPDRPADRPTDRPRPSSPAAGRPDEPGFDPSMSQVIQRYFNEDDDGPAGEHTQLIRSAYRAVKQERERRYHWVILGVLALLVGALGFGIMQRMQNRRVAEQAAALFQELRVQDLQIAQFREALESSENRRLEDLLAAAEAQRERMAVAYDGLIEEFGLYRRLNAEEELIYRMARVFNESQFAIPAGFVREVEHTIRDYWQNPDAGGGKARFERAIRRARENGYIPLIVDKLRTYGLPPEFFYLALQESDLTPDAVGPDTRWGRAKGMWQFIPSTAMRYGLDVGERTDTPYPDRQDERLDVALASEAAARYLLYIYGTPAQASGLLVMASYNWGEHRVINKLQSLSSSEVAIDAAFEGIAENPNARNYWRFLTEYEERMPEETKDYVLKIFSAAVIGQNPRHFGFDFDDPLRPYIEQPAGTAG